MFKALHPGNVGIRAGMRECLQLAKDAGFEGMDLEIREADELARANSRGLRQRCVGCVRVKIGGMGTPVELARQRSGIR